MDWDGWTMPRVVVAFVALAFVMMWIQVFLLHGRSAFHRREQYVPVLEAPLLVLAGAWLVFAPSANAVLASVRPQEAGQASGATNAIRELGGVMGVAVLASVFSASGSYASPQAFTDGLLAALPIGAAVLAVGALAALLVPGRRRPAAEAAAGVDAAERALTVPA